MVVKISVAVLALLVGSANAVAESEARVAAATSAEQCLKQSFELADKIEGKTLTEADLDRLDDLLAEMEALCESDRFADAASIADTISAELGDRQQ